MAQHRRWSAGRLTTRTVVRTLVALAVTVLVRATDGAPGHRAEAAALPAALEAAAPADRAGLLSAALHDMTDERADEILRDLLAQDPEDEEAYRALLRLSDRRPITRESPRYEAARRLLPEGFREYESDRFIVLSYANARWTLAQIERMERVYHQFRRWTRRLDLRPLPLRHKLVCVLFETREEYAVFGRNHDRVTAEWIFGYYSLPNDRTVFFNGEAEDGIDDFTRLRSIATTIHETTHQLLYHCRVQSPYVQYPVWLTEGLATTFETDAPNEAFGPERDYEPRRERFRRLLDDGRLLPLRTLIQLDEMPTGNDAGISNIYNQSYAFVMWLSRYRRAELRDYLISIKQEKPGRPTPARYRELFVRAFGDVERLESRWLHEEIASCRQRDAIAGARGPAADADRAERRLLAGAVFDAAASIMNERGSLFEGCCHETFDAGATGIDVDVCVSGRRLYDLPGVSR